MALSGSYYKNVGSHWRLQLEWSGSQSITGNYTDITAKMYWIARDGYGAVYSSASKTSAIRYNGGSWHTQSGQLAKLSGNQKKLINTYSFRVNHKSDGTASFSLDGYFDAQVTLSGTYYNRISMGTKSFTLNTIPRTSKLTSSPSWTAGNNLGVTISRASSGFTHTVNIYVKKSDGSWSFIKGQSGIGTSKTISFNGTELTNIFSTLSGRSSAETRIYLDTYSGSTKIGFETYYGKISSPRASTTSFGGRDFNIGDTISGNVSRSFAGLTHTIQLVFGGTTYKLLDKSSTLSWSYNTSNIASSLYSKIPNANSIKGKIQILSYYNGIQISGKGEADIIAHVVNSNPQFSASSISYKDTNQTALDITGNDQYIVQNVSELTAYVSTAAKAVNGASLSKYVILVNGQEKSLTSATGSVNMGKIAAGTNQTLTVKAVDSRGNSTSVTKNVTVIPYQAPTLTAKLERENKFENLTRIRVEGTFSALTIGGANKNLVKSLTYQYRPRGASSYGSEETISFTTAGSSLRGTNFALDLDNTKDFEFIFKVEDKLSSKEYKAVVGVGTPILFVDSRKKSVGIGTFPKDKNSLEIAGHIKLPRDEWFQKGNRGAIDLNNSDISGLNGLYFGITNKDVADNQGEGLLFPRRDTPEDSLLSKDFDNFRILDREVLLNGSPIHIGDDNKRILWEGVFHMHSGHSVSPSRKITDCPNGWCFVWSDYTSKENNYDFVYTYVHKNHVHKFDGRGTHHLVAAGVRTDQYLSKYLYVFTDKVTGNDSNNDSDVKKNVVLRQILAW
ncbi:hypothetical protein [Bacillus haynesii]|uniref:hypothetical protein n=1 Tax=Bacillus haynesii TaxID=1925021 RepID=UPI0022820147|nr:hypothetical protein [Bacillus haynesii]MCY9324083.1 DUF859 domain-containing protein [Bacillus haynesii]